MLLKNKVALITGGGEGIGKSTALLMSKEGAKVAVLGRTSENVVEVVKEIADAGGEVIPVIADISRPVQMQGAVKQIIDRWQKLDIVFANAGINGTWAPIEDLSVDDWNETIKVNLTGTFITIKYTVPYLKENGGSIIINSSVNGNRIFSNTGATAYSCTKAAQTTLAKMLAVELAKYKIRVNVICPGSIDTEIDDNTREVNIEKEKEKSDFQESKIPLTRGEPGKPVQTAQLVMFLASEKSDHITGTEIYIDGAQSLIKG